MVLAMLALAATFGLGSCTSINDVQAPSCSYDVAPTAASFDRAGGSGTLNVNASGVCGWTASASATWVTITGGDSGQGAGTVKYTVGTNPSTATRVATMTIAGENVTITQGASPCSYTVDPTSVSVDASASSGTITVTSASGCAWTATSSVGWITVTSGASGSANGAVGYSVAANGASSGRTGTLTVAGRTVTIVQAATASPTPAPSPNCTYSISPASASFGSSGGSGHLDLTTSANCAWTATSSDAWISVTTANGTGGTAIFYAVAENAGTSARNGTIMISGQVFTVTQQGATPAPTPCSFSVSPTSASVPAAGGGGAVSIAAPAGCAWTATSSVGWMGISSAASGSSSGTVTYSVGPNGASTARSGTLTIAGQTVTINQAGAACVYTVTPTSASVPNTGGTGSFDVTAPVGCGWTATSNASWLSVTAGGTGSSNGTVQYSAAANTLGSSRSATLTIAGQPVTVTQAAACVYTISPTSQNFGKGGGTGTVNVTAAAGCTWTAAENVTWITITSGLSGSGNGAVKYTVDTNTTGKDRSGTMLIAGEPFTVNEGK